MKKLLMLSACILISACHTDPSPTNTNVDEKSASDASGNAVMPHADGFDPNSKASDTNWNYTEETDQITNLNVSKLTREIVLDSGSNIDITTECINNTTIKFDMKFFDKDNKPLELDTSENSLQTGRVFNTYESFGYLRGSTKENKEDRVTFNLLYNNEINITYDNTKLLKTELKFMDGESTVIDFEVNDPDLVKFKNKCFIKEEPKVSTNTTELDPRMYGK